MQGVGFFFYQATHFFQNGGKLCVSLDAVGIDIGEGHLPAGYRPCRQKIRGTRPVAFHPVGLGFIAISCFDFEMLVTLIINMDPEGLHYVERNVGIRF